MIFLPRARTRYWVLVFLVILMFCVPSFGGDVLKNPLREKVTDELIEKIKSEGWLDLSEREWLGGPYPCMWMLPEMSWKTYYDCVLVDAALLPPLDPKRRQHFGQYYDPVKYHECRKKYKRSDTRCKKYRLLRDEKPPVWPYPDAPPIQWPEAPKESGYYPGISSKAYFRHLCETEAGKFVYRTVEGVEGVYQVRPRKRVGDEVNRDRYVLEDPYHQTMGEPTEPALPFVGAGKFRFFETSLYEVDRSKSPVIPRYQHESMRDKAPTWARYIRYFGYGGEWGSTPLQKEYVTELKSRYGYVWRGIKRPHDRELGIAGGELAVIDLKTNEILGLWRGFMRSRTRSGGPVWWLTAEPCPAKPPLTVELYRFVSEVLKPVRSQGGDDEDRGTGMD